MFLDRLVAAQAWIAETSHRVALCAHWQDHLEYALHEGASFPLEIMRSLDSIKNTLQRVLHALVNRLEAYALWDEALQAIEALLPLLPIDSVTPRFADLETALARIMAHIPDDRVSPNVRGVLVYFRLKLDAPDVAPLLEDITSTSLHESVSFPLLHMLATKGLRSEGRRIAQAATQGANLHGADPRRQLYLAALLVQNEAFPQADTILRHIDETRLGRHDSQNLLLSFYVRFGRPFDALRLVDRLVQSKTPWQDVHLFEAFALKTLFRHEDALAALSRYVDRQGFQEQYFYMQGQLLWELNRSEDALTVLRQGMKHPSCAAPACQGVLQHFLALVHRTQGDLNASLEAHTRSIELYPLYWQSYFAKAQTLRHVGRDALARECAATGASQSMSINNLCGFLHEALQDGPQRGLLTPESALAAFASAKHFMARWLPLQAWCTALALRSMHAHGMEDEYKLAVDTLSSMAGPLAPDMRGDVCEALSRPKPFQETDTVRLFAQAAFPHLPRESLDRQILAKECTGR